MSKVIEPDELAPDFELTDLEGNSVRLSDFRGKPVVLSFLRGFMWPYCRAQLARMRDGYQEFERRGAAILAVGPDSPEAFRQYWTDKRIPFIGLPDPSHSVARTYRQEVNLFKLGRMPLNCVIDAQGYVRFVHYGSSMSDIPANEEFLHVIDELNAAS